MSPGISERHQLVLCGCSQPFHRRHIGESAKQQAGKDCRCHHSTGDFVSQKQAVQAGTLPKIKRFVAATTGLELLNVDLAPPSSLTL
ncbi:hypothetical protein GCM10007856_01210 [Azospirillum oryzae]|nr:hypothetical protein GCM10007856_01210 [Azospirillum oryzae]